MLAVAIILGITNMAMHPNRTPAWDKAYQFTVHAYAPHMSTSMQFTGPFMSKVRVIPSAQDSLKDNSEATHRNCSADFAKQEFVEKCRMMRSGPMKLGNVANVWSVLGEQSTFILAKHICIIFFVVTLFWAIEFLLHERTSFPKQTIRNVVVLIALGVLVADVVSNFFGTKNLALGSVSTAFAFVVLCFLIICFEYAGMNVEQSDHTSEFIGPKNQHMNRNIYMSYAFLLLLPQIVVFILSNTHDAIVDVHIQLIFLSFIFYATLDVFQTRCIAVLLCLKDTDLKPLTEQEHTDYNTLTDEIHVITRTEESRRSPEQAETFKNKTAQKLQLEQKKIDTVLHLDLGLVKCFVVLAFSLCKFFVLIPSLVLLQTQYTARNWQKSTVGVHYALLALPLLDLAHIISDAFNTMHVFKNMHDVFKGFVLLFYVAFILSATLLVDSKI